MSFLRPSGEHAYVCLSAISASGKEIVPKGQAGFMAEFRGRVDQDSNLGVGFALQTIHSSLVKLPDTAEALLISKHQTFRSNFAEQLREKSLESPTSEEGVSE